MTDTASPLETELRFAVPLEAWDALKHHPAFGDPRKTEDRHEVTTYFDTDDQTLARNGISLRVRRVGDTSVQTVKLAGAQSGVADARGEWEWPVAGDSPELVKLAGTPASALLSAGLGDRLRPFFVTDIRRRILLVQPADGSLVEAALGEGEVRAGDASESVSELELELKQGPPGPLYSLALDLAAAAPLAIEPESKAEHGLRLATGAPPPVHKPEDLDLDGGLTGAAAAQAIVDAVLGHMLANVPAARAGRHEGVHQVRVAIRRLRAALRLLQPCLERRAYRRFDGELRRLGQVFGEARDWDVFALETLPAAERDAPGADHVRLLGAAAAARREAAHTAVRIELASAGFTGLVLGLAAWVDEGAATPALLGDAVLGQRVETIAPALLDRLADSVAKRGRHLGRASGEDLHRLRKALKKLRYGVEFLEGVYRHRSVRWYLNSCKVLQEQLGTVNDAAMTGHLAERLAADGTAGLAVAVAALAAWGGARGETAVGHVPKLWKAFTAEPRPWA
jgi:inorganic triphosphatase YgiF